MSRLLTTRAASLLAAGAMAASAVAFSAPSANAAPVFVDAETVMDSFSGAGNSYTGAGAGCTTTATASADPVVDPPVVENGAATTVAPSVTATAVNDDDATDTATSSAQAVVTGSVKSVGGLVSRIDLDATGTYAFNTSKAASACQHSVSAGADLEFRFTLTQPMFMHLDFKSTGGAYSEVYVYADSITTYSEPYYDHYGRGLKFTGEDTVYLPAGVYDGYFEGSVDVRTFSATSGSATTSAHATFTVPGSNTAVAIGKAKKYTNLPTTRSCTANTLTPTVTGNKKRAATIKSIAYFLNDVKVKKVKNVKKGEAVTLSVAADAAADLTAEVTVKPKKKGQKPKTYEVSASYEACS